MTPHWRFGLVGFKAVVLVEGGGANELIGTDAIVLGWIQNVTASTITVHYGKGTATQFPTSVAAPWLDSARDTDYTGVKPVAPAPPVQPGTGGSKRLRSEFHGSREGCPDHTFRHGWPEPDSDVAGRAEHRLPRLQPTDIQPVAEQRGRVGVHNVPLGL